MTLSREEQETAILFNAANRETVHVFSDDPVWQRKMERAGAKFVREVAGGGKEYELQYNQISIRKLRPKREMTEEQKIAARERMNKMREKKNDQ